MCAETPCGNSGAAPRCWKSCGTKTATKENAADAGDGPPAGMPGHGLRLFPGQGPNPPGRGRPAMFFGTIALFTGGDEPMSSPSDPYQAGSAFPLGATVGPEGVNFSVYSRNAAGVELLLFDNGAHRHDHQTRPGQVQTTNAPGRRKARPCRHPGIPPDSRFFALPPGKRCTRRGYHRHSPGCPYAGTTVRRAGKKGREASPKAARASRDRVTISMIILPDYEKTP